MLTTIIRAVIGHRVIVLSAVAVLFASSIYSVRIAPLDAIPDISEPQVVVYAKWPRSPELLDEEIVTPLARALLKSGPGDRVVLRAPNKTEPLEILGVEYAPIPMDPWREPPGAEAPPSR